MKTDTNPPSLLDPLLSIDELAEYLGVPIKTIYEWRQSGRGPVGIRMGRHLKFARQKTKSRHDHPRLVSKNRRLRRNCPA
jgi:excisionase family DNA binding protein